MVFVTEDHEEQLTFDCWTKHDRNGLTAQRLKESKRLKGLMKLHIHGNSLILYMNIVHVDVDVVRQKSSLRCSFHFFWNV